VTETVLAKDMHLFDIKPRKPFQASGWGNYDFFGDRYAATPNEPNAIRIHYYLRDNTAQKVVIKVADFKGLLIRSLDGTAQQGLNTLQWDMRDGERRAVPGGDYVVTVEIDGRSFVKTAKIR
jgi:hypothetical protein